MKSIEKFLALILALTITSLYAGENDIKLNHAVRMSCAQALAQEVEEATDRVIKIQSEEQEHLKCMQSYARQHEEGYKAMQKAISSGEIPRGDGFRMLAELQGYRDIFLRERESRGSNISARLINAQKNLDALRFQYSLALISRQQNNS